MYYYPIEAIQVRQHLSRRKMSYHHTLFTQYITQNTASMHWSLCDGRVTMHYPTHQYCAVDPQREVTKNMFNLQNLG